MKLTTIWSISAMTLGERLRRTGEAFVQAAAHRLPRRLAYWSYIDTTVRHSAANPHAEVAAIQSVDVIRDFR